MVLMKVELTFRLVSESGRWGRLLMRVELTSKMVSEGRGWGRRLSSLWLHCKHVKVSGSWGKLRMRVLTQLRLLRCGRGWGPRVLMAVWLRFKLVREDGSGRGRLLMGMFELMPKDVSVLGRSGGKLLMEVELTSRYEIGRAHV